MRPSIPVWATRALGLPGAVSFRRFKPLVGQAAGLEPQVQALSDTSLRNELRALRLQTGKKRLPDDETVRYLALAREAAARTVGLRAFDQQLLACCALLSGHAVEMDTGEGKTLVGTLAAVGHVLAGRNVHVISVNDYLAERDVTWMRPFAELLGISVGWIGQHTPAAERAQVYQRDIVYAPVSEIGFDVLRDRFANSPDERVDPIFDVAIVDEADAVMIDEAMVPLVLAGNYDEDQDDVNRATALVEKLGPEDFSIDGDQATVSLTDAGLDKLEAHLGGINLYDTENIDLLTRINLALHAQVLVHRDVDYLVADGSIKLINTSRGRIAHLQRWPDGLHAALEAKEGLELSPAGMTLDSITIQDLILRYKTVSGMSGTMIAVAEELIEFYQLPAGRIQRHQDSQRVDLRESILLTETEKTRAVIAEVTERHQAGQPVLVGTQSVAESEALAAQLHAGGVQAQVLNAKNDAREAAIIARAGEFSAVTISTQISGRGTDIRLGGPDEHDHDRVARTGGVTVIATGRFPSHRLDIQLRGRAGRQGDPGVSHIFSSLEDGLVQVYATSEMLATIRHRRNALTPRERRRITNSSQAIAEGQRTDHHRATWTYHRAITAQRETVLKHREQIISSRTAYHRLYELIPENIENLQAANSQHDLESLTSDAALYYLDDQWVTHLALLQEIRDGIHLRALGGEKPSDEFHRIALREFQGFFDRAYRATAEFIANFIPNDINAELKDLGLPRPSATWTYMLTDNPLGSPTDRFARHSRRSLRSLTRKRKQSG